MAVDKPVGIFLVLVIEGGQGWKAGWGRDSILWVVSFPRLVVLVAKGKQAEQAIRRKPGKQHPHGLCISSYLQVPALFELLS